MLTTNTVLLYQLPIYLLALCMVCLSCGEEPALPPLFAEVKDTHWVLKVKWDVAPDSIIIFLHFQSNGEGTEETDGLVSLNYLFDWQQTKDLVDWEYRDEDTYYYGKISADGMTMSGTCRTELLLSDDLRGNWVGYKR